MQESLRIFIEPLKEKASYQLVKFDGEFDKVGFSGVRQELDDCVKNFGEIKDPSVNSLVFDFSSLKFINSEAIGYLMEVHSHLVHSGKKLILVSLNDHVKDVFEAIGINQVILTYKTLDDFLNV